MIYGVMRKMNNMSLYKVFPFMECNSIRKFSIDLKLGEKVKDLCILLRQSECKDDANVESLHTQISTPEQVFFLRARPESHVSSRETVIREHDHHGLHTSAEQSRSATTRQSSFSTITYARLSFTRILSAQAACSFSSYLTLVVFGFENIIASGSVARNDRVWFHA